MPQTKIETLEMKDEGGRMSTKGSQKEKPKDHRKKLKDHRKDIHFTSSIAKLLVENKLQTCVLRKSIAISLANGPCYP